MSTYDERILGPVPASESSVLFSAQMDALEKQYRKLKKRKKGKKGKRKKKLKRLEQQLQVLALEHQQLMELEKKRHKQKKGKKGKKKLKKQLRALERQCQQRQSWLQDAITVSAPKILELILASKRGQPLKPQPPRALRSQAPLALPAPRD